MNSVLRIIGAPFRWALIALITATLAPVVVLFVQNDLAGLASLYAIGVVGAIALNGFATARSRRPGIGRRERIGLYAVAVFMGAVQHFSIKLRASTASDAVAGEQEFVLRHNSTGESDILRDVELLQIGGQAYRLNAQALEPDEGYQALAAYVQLADAQELMLVGLPGF